MGGWFSWIALNLQILGGIVSCIHSYIDYKTKDDSETLSLIIHWGCKFVDEEHLQIPWIDQPQNLIILWYTIFLRLYMIFVVKRVTIWCGYNYSLT